MYLVVVHHTPDLEVHLEIGLHNSGRGLPCFCWSRSTYCEIPRDEPHYCPCDILRSSCLQLCCQIWPGPGGGQRVVWDSEMGRASWSDRTQPSSPDAAEHEIRTISYHSAEGDAQTLVRFPLNPIFSLCFFKKKGVGGRLLRRFAGKYTPSPVLACFCHSEPRGN